MVIARKTPAAPSFLFSRSDSTEPLPRAVKTKTETTQTSISTATPLAPVDAPLLLSDESQCSTPITQVKHSGASFARRGLWLLLLSVFAFYAAVISKQGSMHTLIHSSRKYVLDPYVISPLDSLLQHTKPHLTPLKPYAAPLEPYVSSTIEFAQTRIIPGASNVLSLAAAQYETHIASRLRWLFIEQYWNGVVQPNYFKKLHPKLELYSRPLRVYYTHTIIPGAQKALIYTHEAYTRVRPSTIYHFRVARRNARSVYATTKPRVIGAYEAVESLVLKGYAHVHPYLVAVVDMWKAQALFVAQRAQDARQKFVDPHVQLIWDKVVERSGSPTAAPVPTSVTDEPLSVRTSSATRLYTRPTQPEPESQKI